MRWGLGGLAGIVAWVGWLAICPALGFPTLSGAAMLNRVLAPREDPGSWPGWALLLIGLASAALVYVVAAERSRWRASIASGLAYGAICWLIAGAIVMPVLGLAVPAAQPAPGAAPPPPDPMQGSFMMLHVGPAAPIAALVAWLLFGAVLGGTARLRVAGATDDAGQRRAFAMAIGAAVVVLVSVAVAARLGPEPAGSSATSPQTLANGPVEALPPGAVFVSVIELPQAPGARLGPHAHVAGFAYTLRGVETLAFGDGQVIRVGPNEGGFMGTQVAHAHVNADDRVPAALLGLLILAAAAAFCITQGAPGRAARLAPALLVLLIAAGAVGAWNPWSNDWLFISVRPVAARGAGMPLPSASRLYESPDLGALPPGPYVEKLEEITMAPGAAPFEVNSTGATVLFVLSGTVRLESADGSSQVGPREAMLARTGSSVRMTSTGGGPANVLIFSIAPTR